MIDLERYKQLKEESDRHQREFDRTQGALAQLMGQLDKEFGCESCDEAEEQLTQMKKEVEKDQQRFGKLLDSFERELTKQTSGGE